MNQEIFIQALSIDSQIAKENKYLEVLNQILDAINSNRLIEIDAEAMKIKVIPRLVEAKIPDLKRKFAALIEAEIDTCQGQVNKLKKEFEQL